MRENEDEPRFLDLVLQACLSTHDNTMAGQPPFLHLAKLVHVLRVGEILDSSAWTRLRTPGREEETILTVARRRAGCGHRIG